jgi:6-pyruvoyl-tetrahydropterin synthase
MYLIELHDAFNAVHAVRIASGEWEEPHPHVWRVRAFLGADRLNRNYMVADFVHIEKSLRTILDELEGRDLNKLSGLGASPTTELLARYIFDHLARHLAGYHTNVTLAAVAVRETENCWAWYLA